MANSKSRTFSTRSKIGNDSYENKMPPKGATIIEEEKNTETEEIENGFLITKRHNGRYKIKDSKNSKDNYGEYFSYTKKWYSKNNPLTIKVNDQSLAEAFEEE